MVKTPFKLRSGNSPLFQNMGSRAIDEEIKNIMDEPIEIEIPENIEKNPEIKSEKIPLPL